MNIDSKWKTIIQSQEYDAFMKLIHKRSTKIFLKAIAFRIVMYILGVIIFSMAGACEDTLTFQVFLDSWKRWDANGYLGIAQNGYSAWIENDMYICLVFFPLYPWAVRTVALFAGNYILSGLITSTVCYGIACAFIDKLLCEEYSKEMAENSIVAMSVFPFAFFFGSVMTEALFVALLAMFFYYLKKQKWLVVAVLGFLACMTKVQGVLLAFPILVALLDEKKAFTLIRQREWKSLWKEVIWNGCKCVPMFGGTIVYLCINYAVAGDPFIFLRYQKENWGNGFLDIFSTIKYVSENAMENWHTSLGVSMWIPETILFAVYLCAIIYGVLKKLKPVYLSYLIIWFIITYSSSWLISGGRYTICALPLFMLEGIWVTEKPKWKLPIWGISLSLMIIYYYGFFTERKIL